MRLKRSASKIKRARGEKISKLLKVFLLVIVLLPCAVIVAVLAERAVKRTKIYAGFNLYFSEVVSCSEKFDLQPELVFAIIRAESGFNAAAESDKGACGLMQLMPETASYAAELCGYSEEIDLFNPNCNIYLGCAYLNYLFKRFNNEKNVICAYNAGEGRVIFWLSEQNDEFKNGGAPLGDNKKGITELKKIPFSETKNYYARVCDYKFLYARTLKKTN